MKFFFLSVFLSLFNLQGNAQDYQIVGNEIKFEKGLRFKSGSAELEQEDIKILSAVKDFLKEKTFISLMRIEGNVTGTNKNQYLSEQRAKVAAQWLIDAGIDSKRLIAVGFGDTKPSEQSAGISFKMAAVKDRLIGGVPADGGGKVVSALSKTAK